VQTLENLINWLASLDKQNRKKKEKKKKDSEPCPIKSMMYIPTQS
jgi:hypothetical protein